MPWYPSSTDKTYKHLTDLRNIKIAKYPKYLNHFKKSSRWTPTCFADSVTAVARLIVVHVVREEWIYCFSHKFLCEVR